MTEDHHTPPEDQDLILDEIGVKTGSKYPLRCVFSTEKTIKIGTGTTARRQLCKNYYYVHQINASRFIIQQLNGENIPAGKKEEIDKDEILSNYFPEVDYFNKQVNPALMALNKHIAKGDRHRKNKELFSAEYEYQNALKIDNASVKATFGLGLVYLERQERTKAEAVFNNLVQIEGAFEEEHKHLFNEFGIRLRKNAMFHEAVDYYSRAMEVGFEDDHLHFNLARAYYECGNWKDAVTFLILCLELNEDIEEAQDFLKFISTLCSDESKCAAYGKPKISDHLGETACTIIKRMAGMTAMPHDQRRTALQKIKTSLQIDKG